MDIPFLSNSPGPEGSYTENMYLASETECSRPALIKRPGLLSRVTIDEDEPVRGMIAVGNVLYVVVGTNVYTVDTDWVATQIAGATIPGSGLVNIVTDNSNNYVCFCNGLRMYAYETSGGTWTDVRAASSIDYQDQFFLATNPGYATFSSSEPDDPTDWTAADYGIATGKGDLLVALRSVRRTVYLLGTETSEIWYNAGNPTFVFARTQPGMIQIGCGAVNSVVEIDSWLYFIDDNRRLVRLQGSSYEVISTEEINNHIAGYTVSSAEAYPLLWHGHMFYVLTFPDDDVTWVFDILSGSWFKWNSEYERSFDHRFRCMCAAYFNKQWVGGCFSTGQLYTLDKDTYTDDGDRIRWRRTLPPIHSDQKMFFFKQFQLEMKVGVSLSDTNSYRVWLDWSNDNGKTWSNEHFANIGVLGRYSTRVVWRRLGVGRNRVFRVTGTDPFETELYGATLYGVPGIH